MRYSWRLRDLQEAGGCGRLHELLLAALRAAGQIDLSRVIPDSSSVRAIGMGQKLGRRRACTLGSKNDDAEVAIIYLGLNESKAAPSQ